MITIRNIITSIKNNGFAPLKLGFKIYTNFGGNVFGDIGFSLIKAFILTLIWAQLGYVNSAPYFIVISLLIPNGYYRRLIIRKFSAFVKEGWDMSLTRPINTFSQISMKELGRLIGTLAINIIIGYAWLSLIGASVNLGIVLLSLPIVFLFDLAITYAITGLAYYFYSLWGFSSILSWSGAILGGKLIPLSLLSPEAFKILNVIPCVNRFYYITAALLQGTIPWNAYINLGLWSIVFLIIGYYIHFKGWKKFEAQGG